MINLPWETTNRDQLTEAVTAQRKVYLSDIQNIPYESTLAYNLKLANLTPTIKKKKFYSTLIIVLHIYNERKASKKARRSLIQSNLAHLLHI